MVDRMSIRQGSPLIIINAAAPIQICDNGNFIGTWFAMHEMIFNIGVSPYVEVQMAVFPIEQREHRIVINAENYGTTYLSNLRRMPPVGSGATSAA